MADGSVNDQVRGVDEMTPVDAHDQTKVQVAGARRVIAHGANTRIWATKETRGHVTVEPRTDTLRVIPADQLRTKTVKLRIW